MHDPSAAGVPAATTASGRPLTLPGPWPSAPAEELERERLLGPARASDAGRQFARCFARWPGALDHLRLAALRALAADRPVDPNDPDVWSSRAEPAQAILRRHGVAKLSPGRLTLAAIGELIAGQARADREAGLEWNTITVPPAGLDEPLRRAHSSLAISLDDPAIYAHRSDQRHVPSRTLGVSAEQADDLSRWVLTHPDQSHTDELRCWRIGSRTSLRGHAARGRAGARLQAPHRPGHCERGHRRGRGAPRRELRQPRGPRRRRPSSTDTRSSSAARRC